MVFVANLWRSSVSSARILFALQPMQSPKRKGVYSLDGRISTTKGVASGAEFDLNAMKLNAFFSSRMQSGYGWLPQFNPVIGSEKNDVNP